MDQLSLFLFLINTILFLAAYYSTKGISYGHFRGSALNPIFLIALFLFLNSILFFIHYGDAYVFHERRTFRANILDWQNAYSVFTLFNFCFTAGILFPISSSTSPINYSRLNRYHNDFLQKKIDLYILIALSLFIYYVIFFIYNIRSFGDILALTSDRFHATREFTPFLYVAPAIRGAFFLYALGANWRKFTFWIILSSTLFIMYSTGVRLNIFSVILGLFIVLSIRGFHINFRTLILLFPMVGVLSIVTRYFLRAQNRFDSISELVRQEGGLVNVLINPIELHYQNTLTAIYGLNLQSLIHRYPGEEVLLGLTLPIPRSIFAGKSISASAEFSYIMSPEIYLHSLSQSTLGVFGVTLIEWGVVLGCLFIFITAFLYAALVRRNATRLSDVGLLVVFTLASGSLTYVRSGVYDFGLLFWPAFAVVIARSVLKFVLAPSHAKAKDTARTSNKL